MVKRDGLQSDHHLPSPPPKKQISKPGVKEASVRTARETDRVGQGKERSVSFYCRSAVNDGVRGGGSLDDEIRTLSD